MPGLVNNLKIDLITFKNSLIMSRASPNIAKVRRGTSVNHQFMSVLMNTALELTSQMVSRSGISE